MGLSIWQLMLVAVLFLLMFGRGKIPALMSDLAAGIKNFKSGLRDDELERTQASGQSGPKAESGRPEKENV
ncbi:Sec-independent protein translocase protein TatA [Methylocaldum marinum]|uniref:Sec-independent protein translocase protein TatA n=1 Tax=Methylocaldum marinum TaxID=1432792 RepID=A0A250KV55_9GAMM|nr:twin-arginine translocase TatA/TatE family subunit [Methylocaldum marinum]BBA35553.1 Sec-independent protein translocase protein TatA [Methylocaldum marinum]